MKWPTEDRINEIGQNGNTGEHYELVKLDQLEMHYEQRLHDVREARREFINRNNLNKC